MRIRVLVPLAFVACRVDATAPVVPPPPALTGETPAECREPAPPPLSTETLAATADVLDAVCTPDPANVLRATCHVTLSAPALAEFEVTDGVETVVFTTDSAGVEADFPIWGLYAGTTWVFTARAGGAEIAGEIVPGPLPYRVDVDPGYTGSGPSTLVHWLGAIDCDAGGTLTVLDAAGRVRWYQDSGGVDVEMVQFTDDGTVLAIADNNLMVEYDVAGNTVLRYDDLPFPIHHDVTRHNECVYVLSADIWTASDDLSYVEDIVVALGPDGEEVWRWQTHDWLDPKLAGAVQNGQWDFAFPGSYDAWHANGITVTDDEDVIVSLYRPGTVLRVAGDTGAIEWAIGGDVPGSGIPDTLTAVDGGGSAAFNDQHHPTLGDGDVVTVFDNFNARGLALAIDEDARTTTFVSEQVVALSTSCPVQGSVFPLAGGHHLVMCPDAHLLTEFDSDGEVVGTFALECPNMSRFPRIMRAQPIDLWDSVSAGGVTATRR